MTLANEDTNDYDDHDYHDDQVDYDDLIPWKFVKMDGNGGKWIKIGEVEC